ncbi:Uncharacterized protein Rs2_00833 [Raphanus sativus]|nr:Uncharacterized protein Rs2_00833 [Raphanus sativus]
MNSNSKTSVSGDLTSAKLINSVGEPVNRSSETADSSVIARSKRGITGDSSANVVAGEARKPKPGPNDFPGAGAEKTSLCPVVNRVGTAKTDAPTDPLLIPETLEEEPHRTAGPLFCSHDVVADVQSGGIAAEEELQLLYEPNHHEEGDESEVSQETERLAMEYYDPKPGIMMTNEKVPLYEQKFDYLLCDLKYDAEEFLVHGKMEIVKDDDEDGA